MRHLALVTAATVVFPRLSPAQTRPVEVYTIDAAHSVLDFTTRLVGFNRVRGTFGSWQGDFVYDPARPATGFVSVSAEVASIMTQVEERDRDLKAPDFFDAARFPRITFDGYVRRVDGTRFEIEGRLAIRDSVRSIRVPMELTTPESTDPFGNRRLVFSGKLSLNRRDFGVVGPRFWNQAISDSVGIELELAGRIWDYRRVGFRRGAYYGPALIAAADSNRFDAAVPRLKTELGAEADSTRFPGPFEMEITAGRLIQSGKLREARVALELVSAHAESRWTEVARSGHHTRLGEVMARLGRGEDARRHLERALTLDSTNTNARAWRAAVEGMP